MSMWGSETQLLFWNYYPLGNSTSTEEKNIWTPLMEKLLHLLLFKYNLTFWYVFSENYSTTVIFIWICKKFRITEKNQGHPEIEKTYLKRNVVPMITSQAVMIFSVSQSQSSKWHKLSGYIKHWGTAFSNQFRVFYFSTIFWKVIMQTYITLDRIVTGERRQERYLRGEKTLCVCNKVKATQFMILHRTHISPHQGQSKLVIVCSV